MKKHLIIIGAIILPIGPVHAIMATDRCTSIECDGLASEEPFVNCEALAYTSQCYKNSSGEIVKINSCTTCPSGYDLTKKTFNSSVCPTILLTYNTCTSACADCDDCTSDTTWSPALKAGYITKTTRTCDCGTCVATTEYRCAAGYYGSSTNGTSGCTRCPTETGVYADSGLTTLIRGTSAAGSATQLSCYIPAGTVFYDSTGSGTYDEDTIYCY